HARVPVIDRQQHGRVRVAQADLGRGRERGASRVVKRGPDARGAGRHGVAHRLATRIEAEGVQWVSEDVAVTTQNTESTEGNSHSARVTARPAAQTEPPPVMDG